MKRADRRGLRSTTGLVFSLAICLSISMRPTALSQVSDEASLRILVERFFTAYQTEDLEEIAGLWSEKSPDFPAARQTLQQTFVNNDKIRVNSLEIVKVTIGTGTAVVRVAFEESAEDAKTRKPATGFGKSNRTLHCVKESGNWKIWQYVSREEELAGALLALQTDEDRRALLQTEKHLITVQLQRALIALGSRKANQGDHRQSQPMYHLAQNIAEQLDDKRGLALAFRGLGTTKYLQGDYKQALADQNKSLKLFEELNDKAGIAAALTNIGILYHVQGSYQQAMENYNKSLKLAGESGEKAEIARVINNIGAIHQARGNYPKAVEFYEKGLGLAEELADKGLTARARNNLGIITFLQGNYPGALKHFHASMTLAEGLGDKRTVVRTLNNIGEIHRLQGNYRLATEYLQRSLTLGEESGDKTSVMNALNNIGLIHLSQSDFSKALQYYRRSLKLAEELGERPMVAVSLSNIGSVYYSQGHYAQSLEYSLRSVRLSEQLGDKASAGATLNNIGNIHHRQGNYSQSLDYHNKALKLGEELGNKTSIAIALNNIGATYLWEGKSAEALECYQRGLKLAQELGDKERIASAMASISGIHRVLGNYPEALDYYDKSLKLSEELGDQAAIASTTNYIAEVQHLQGNYQSAVDLANRSADIARKIGVPEYLWKARRSAGAAHYALGRRDEARQAFADAISTIESLRSEVAGGETAQQEFFEDKIAPYYSMVDLLVEQDPAEALAFAERAKGRVLLDVVQTGKIKFTKSMTQQEQDQELNLYLQLVSINSQISHEKLRKQPDSARLSDLDSQLRNARLDFERLQSNLYAAHPELKVQRGQMQPISLEQATDLIPNTGTLLIEFVVTDDRTYLFTLARRQPPLSGRSGAPDPTTLKVYVINIKRKDLAVRVERFRNRVASLDFGFQDEAIKLYDLLLGPARAELKNRTNLVIVPDAMLWELPFQALRTAPRRFLIQDSAISYAPSLTVLLQMTRLRLSANNGAPTLLAFGNPAVARETAEMVNSSLVDQNLGPLPETERQVLMLGKLYGSARSRVYLGPDAREERVKAEAGNYRILHLAAHGILNDKSPMYSHLVLSQLQGSATEDGLLEAWEIMKLDLKADLVVLSACETARGRIGNGEGIIGLTWASFVAGAPTTVVTQWKVESSSTTRLMVDFHRNLKMQRPKAEALRLAMVNLLKTREYNHPFYWAGFVIIGNAR